MGQLDLFAAQSVAAERERSLTRDLEHRRTAAARAAGSTDPVGQVVRRRPALLARLSLVLHPAR
ncbi:hypothetical protein GCM10009584_21260 [Ornithinimicrobium humiphilum]|uniref:Uncharacterized protein n=1 Tax=Ornithinimicrobium humiphilum TaxID=125288 RepID=A0A543KND4_9MICO|nr:hypothetical protein [Ornithinimicrobium humiphilum]TQM96579.1 hypothetical protein FB476_1448 [Ornithinimicrobium humiphilum]